jgi:gamma-tubulin complex component 3
LDARVLEYSPGEIGWDCFALEYKIEAPLNAVLDGKAMVEYDRLFHHLWRLKRVESALSQGWMRVTSNSRRFENIQGKSSLPWWIAVLMVEALRRPWHDSRQLQAQMVHFLRQLQAFCQLEVIECSWQALMDFTDKREGDLDALIAAHRMYLDRVVRKVLLLGSKRDKQVGFPSTYFHGLD